MSKIKELQEKYGSLNKTLAGVDGNAMMIMSTFRQHARRQGWEEEDIEIVLDEARSSDYDHLLGTIMKFTE